MNLHVYISAATDILRWRIMRYWLLALAITLGAFIFLWISVFGTLYGSASTIQNWLMSFSGLPLPGWLLDPIWGGLIALLVTASWFATTYFFSVVLLLVLGLFTPPLVRQVSTSYYPDVHLPSGGSVFDDVISLLLIVGKYMLWFLGLLLLSIPLFPFAPLFFGLWGFLLYRRLLITDVASQIDPSLIGKNRRQGLWLASLIAYGLSLVPVLNLIAPIYGVVLMSHLLLIRKQQNQRMQRQPTSKARDNVPVIEPQQLGSIDEASGD